MNAIWIDGATAFRQVLTALLIPTVAQSKLVEAIKFGKLPAKCMTSSGDRFLYPHGGGCPVLTIDFEKSKGRFVLANYAMGYPPYEAWDFDCLTVSKRHLDSLGAIDLAGEKSADVGRPQGTGYQSTDQQLVARMQDLIASGAARNRTTAAKAVLQNVPGDVAGAGTQASQVRRLLLRFNQSFGTEKNGV